MKENRIWAIFSVIGVLLLGSGCAHTGDQKPEQAAPTASSSASNSNQPSTAQKKSDDDAGGIIGKIPPGSPFSKLTVGMSLEEVNAKIGVPTSHSTYPTGKAFIPFYFGDDRVRTEYRYKGLGVITFSGGGGFSGADNFTIFRVIYDPKETGYSQ